MLFSDRFEPILQSEAAECGIACIAMIANYYDHRVTLPELRRRFVVSTKGTTLKSLMTIADALQFVPRPVRLELNGLAHLRLPCILHWDLSHFVVLVGVRGRKLTIYDPAHGKLVISIDDFSNHFTGIALELTPAPNFKKREKVERVDISDLWSRMTGFIPNIAQIIILSLLLQMMNLFSPLMSQFIMDDAVGKADLSVLTLVTVGALLLAIMQSTIKLVRAFISLRVGVMLNFQMRGNLLRHMLQLPIPWFEKRKLGDIMSRFNSLGPVQSFLTGSFMSILLDGSLAIITFTAMMLYSPLLTFVTLLSLVIQTTVQLASFPYLRNLTKQGIHLNAKVDSVFVETIRGVRAFKIFGKEQERHAVWQNAYADATNNNLRVRKISSVRGEAGLALLSACIGILIFYLGARAIIAGQMTIGMFIAFQGYKAQWDSASQSLIGLVFSYKFLGVHLERLSDVIHADLECAENELPPESGDLGRPLRGKIELRGVSFRHADHEDWVLRNVNLIVNPGEHVACIGPSGGGKSTLVKLLVGLYPPTEGKILIDDLPLPVFGRQAYRKKIGVVMQDDQLFAGTITDNISFFDQDVDLEWVEECAKMAIVHEDILRMPMGYMTMIGDMGNSLSGGQRQRVMLARALYRRPNILFLDEGTANLDPATEAAVANMLTQQEITRIIVAHRPATIEHANRVFSVNNAAIEETVGKGLMHEDA